MTLETTSAYFCSFCIKGHFQERSQSDSGDSQDPEIFGPSVSFFFYLLSKYYFIFLFIFTTTDLDSTCLIFLSTGLIMVTKRGHAFYDPCIFHGTSGEKPLLALTHRFDTPRIKRCSDPLWFYWFYHSILIAW